MWLAREARVSFHDGTTFEEEANYQSVAGGISVRYLGSMRRWYVLFLGLALLVALASCTSTPTPASTDEAAAHYARYYFVARADTGVLEVSTHPATICYSTQSYPARPIELMVEGRGTPERVASYEPLRGQFCDRTAKQEVAAALIANPSTFAVRWSPQPGEASIETQLSIP
jgi:hypothetical protein